MVHCRDCYQRPPLCSECFIREHKYVPFHWAERWNEEGKFFSTCDLSALDPNWSLNLGHSADPCPNATKAMHLNVVETSGPHGTLVRYCQCHGKPDKWQQLFEAHLFPGSVSDPSTAYTFRLMREYEVHSVASKKNARDYTKALAQLANRQFPEQVPVSVLGHRRALKTTDTDIDLLQPVSICSTLMVISEDECLAGTGTWHRRLTSEETNRKPASVLPSMSGGGF